MARRDSKSEARVPTQESRAGSQKLMQALRILLSDEEIKVLVDYVRSQRAADAARVVDPESDSYSEPS